MLVVEKKNLSSLSQSFHEKLISKDFPPEKQVFSCCLHSTTNPSRKKTRDLSEKNNAWCFEIEGFWLVSGGIFCLDSTKRCFVSNISPCIFIWAALLHGLCENFFTNLFFLS